MRVLTMGVVGVCVLTLVAPLANAELITIQIEGVVDTVEDDGDYLEDQIHVGDIITGYYVFDSDTPDQDWLWGEESPSIGRYHYFEAPYGVFLNVNGLVFETDLLNVNFLVGVSNDNPSGADVYWITSYNNDALLNGTTVDSIGWQLEDPTGTILSSDALLVEAPHLLDWEFNHLRLDGERGEYMIHGHILSAVPEPCTLLFLGLGILSVVRRVH